jgi:hypothetical protein
MATHLAHPTIEATGGELETLRLALYPVAHLACNWADDQITKAAHQLARFDDLLDRIRPLAV